MDGQYGNCMAMIGIAWDLRRGFQRKKLGEIFSLGFRLDCKGSAEYTYIRLNLH